ncbi:MAG: filamentous hemagglutinin N-terminal domain-containing protein, partial [Rhodoferax sp.]|nr:filamentous hemagglutinin N-terminal domain-containing protein [Rhodoferax sp.]
MNTFYRLVWNEAAHTAVAVMETARAHGKHSHTVRAVTPGRRAALRLTALLLALGGLAPAWAGAPAPSRLPTGAQVVAGQATVTQPASAVLQVQQSSQAAVINWQSFDLGSAASVNFLQPSAGSSTLNRVLGSNPSQIYGRITAPGQVFFTNPGGIYFGPSASVDVGGLVATTHRISDADFMAGNYRFARNGASGSVVNAGALKAALGGYIALLAPEVRNQGVVVAQLGTVALAAGDLVTLEMLGSQLTSLRVSAAGIQTLVDNASAVLAPGGLIILSAQAADQLQGSVVNNSGSLVATGLALRNGRVVLDAGAHGTALAGGTLNVSHDTGTGGQIRITGKDIVLPSGAQLLATGSQGGGTVLVGGDWQGSGNLPQARSVRMEAGAIVDASATLHGDGGKVVLWSDIHDSGGATTAAGRIAVQGGAQGGNGGQIETSGYRLHIGGIHVQAGAAQGQRGQWLLDPFDYSIGATEANSISSALNAGATVTVDTGSGTASGAAVSGTGPSNPGDITVSSAITNTGSSTLTLNAAHNITLGADISSSSNPLTLNLSAAGSVSGTGNINTNGGLLSISAAANGTL